MIDEIVGSLPALKDVLPSIVDVTSTDSTVLITVETGTGKELQHDIDAATPRCCIDLLWSPEVSG